MSGDLSRAVLEGIYRHARATFPKECCGFVIGSGATAELVECENWQDRYHAVDPETYPRTAETAYTFGGKDLRRLAESLDSDHPATIVYHSHPRVGAYFSAEDSKAALAAGWPVDYLVVDCQEHGVVEAVLFRKHAERDEYVEVARFEGMT
ncbi:MAG TPA: Mov34/MPN/PAD-1 family protein [Enhygromyxa sp.]|nr:Mov34/MPN/PAD-1 family protein [Enhygromyxa sp.]